MTVAQLEEPKKIRIDPIAQEIIERAMRGEGWEDIEVALMLQGTTVCKDYVRRYVLSLPMRRPTR